MKWSVGITLLIVVVGGACAYFEDQEERKNDTANTSKWEFHALGFNATCTCRIIALFVKLFITSANGWRCRCEV